METIVDSRAFSVAQLFADTYTVDFYQREYVWEYKQMEDLITDLSNAFLRDYRITHKTKDVQNYSPYFMGEIVISTRDESRKSIIDGQQRITSITLLLIYLIKKFGNVDGMPTSILNGLIYVDDYGDYKFNLDIPERKECMENLYKKGDYTLPVNPNPSVVNLVRIAVKWGIGSALSVHLYRSVGALNLMPRKSRLQWASLRYACSVN